VRVRVTRRVKFTPYGCGYGWPLPVGFVPVANLSHHTTHTPTETGWKNKGSSARGYAHPRCHGPRCTAHSTPRFRERPGGAPRRTCVLLSPRDWTGTARRVAGDPACRQSDRAMPTVTGIAARVGAATGRLGDVMSHTATDPRGDRRVF